MFLLYLILFFLARKKSCKFIFAADIVIVFLTAPELKQWNAQDLAT